MADALTRQLTAEQLAQYAEKLRRFRLIEREQSACLALLRRSHDGYSVSISHAELASAMQVSRATARRAIHGAIDKGAIEVAPGVETGDGSKNTYLFCWDGRAKDNRQVLLFDQHGEPTPAARRGRQSHRRRLADVGGALLQVVSRVTTLLTGKGEQGHQAGFQGVSRVTLGGEQGHDPAQPLLDQLDRSSPFGGDDHLSDQSRDGPRRRNCWPIAITSEILRSDHALGVLFRFALQQSWVRDTPGFRKGFLVAAGHCAASKTPGPCFTRVVKDRKWQQPEFARETKADSLARQTSFAQALDEIVHFGATDRVIRLVSENSVPVAEQQLQRFAVETEAVKEQMPEPTPERLFSDYFEGEALELVLTLAKSIGARGIWNRFLVPVSNVPRLHIDDDEVLIVSETEQIHNVLRRSRSDILAALEELGSNRRVRFVLTPATTEVVDS